MMIGSKKKKQSKFLSGIGSKQPASAASSAVTAAVEEEVAAPQAPNHITVHEDLAISMKQDMTVESMTVKGYLAVTCRDADFDSGTMNIQLDSDAFSAGADAGFAFKTNPKIDPKAFKNDQRLCLKNKSRGFPVGKPTKIVQWRMSTNDEANVPLTFNCWPETQGDGTVAVTIEYTLENTDLTLYDVSVKIPLGSGEAPEIVRIEEGSHRHNSRQEFLEWGINSINEDNATASFEFVIAGDEEDIFFPVEITFQAETLLSGTSVAAVHDDEGGAISFSSDSALSVQKYEISF
jgi:coatomer subunit delta